MSRFLNRRDYESMAWDDLRATARDLGLVGFSKKSKRELSYAIINERRKRGLPVGEERR